MKFDSEEKCDHKSVGILVWKDRKLLLIERKRFPFGFAPPAGHLDGDSFEEAAKRELREEVGLDVTKLKMRYEEKAENTCRRKGGDWHNWKIYEAKVKGEVKGSPTETKQVGWYSLEEIKRLVNRTRKYLRRNVTEDEWEAEPGIETVWYDWFSKMKLL